MEVRYAGCTLSKWYPEKQVENSCYNFIRVIFLLNNHLVFFFVKQSFGVLHQIRILLPLDLSQFIFRIRQLAEIFHQKMIRSTVCAKARSFLSVFRRPVYH